ncbi:hypothetical protein DPMN_174250 [Dreissena polymorpha]|uniref:Uncharacterized protein n=1 Tax=Dreissena polymorpha TaxID=45954 RepID=A0A9D4E524_DREPO|nr:hypothetical protein DPMN_174250 [Dreissena polymorpha]
MGLMPYATSMAPYQPAHTHVYCWSGATLSTHETMEPFVTEGGQGSCLSDDPAMQAGLELTRDREYRIF